MEKTKRGASAARKAIAAAAAAALAMSLSGVAAPAAFAASAAPAKASISKVTSVAAGKVVVTVKAVKGAKGYQIKVAGGDSVTKTTTKKTLTVSGLTQGAEDTVTARAYTVVKGKKVYGKWSAAQSIHVAGIDTSKACNGEGTTITNIEQANNPDPKYWVANTAENLKTTGSVKLTRKNVTYMQATEYGTDTDLKIELLTPAGASADKTPLLVWINGGGFTSSDPGNNFDTRSAFAKAGYVVASVQHRVSPSNATWPTAIQDIKAAIRYLKANNTKFSFDKNKVAVGGNSSGGYFASMIGVTGNTKTITYQGKEVKLDVGDNLGESSAVNAVLDFYGVSDLTIIGSGLDAALEQGHHSDATTEAILINGARAGFAGKNVFDESMVENVAAASPFTYIDKNDPPMWFVHGTADTLVSPVATKMLQNRAEAAGITTKRTVINGGTHGGLYFIQDSILGDAAKWLDTYATKDIVASEGVVDTAAGTKAYEAKDLPTLAQATEGAIDVPVTSNLSFNVANDVTYKTIKTNGTYTNLKMNIIYPTNLTDRSQKFPVVYVAVCGGFNKSDINQAYSNYMRYAQRGYVVAVAQLRVTDASGSVMPGPLQDGKAGIRWLRAHAADYNINPGCFITIGTSAGGYYAAMLGPTGNTKQYDENNKFDVGDNLEYSSEVQGVVDLYGVSDLTIIGAETDQYDQHFSAANTEALIINGTAFGTNMGGSVFDYPEKTAIYSPFTYLDADDPAYLFFHGNLDTLVSPLATMEYYQKCLDAGLQAERYVFEGTGHGGPLMNGDYALNIIDNFMDGVAKSCGAK